MTKFEKIKSSTIDELAEFLGGAICGIMDDCRLTVSGTCHECAVTWLLEEYEE